MTQIMQLYSDSDQRDNKHAPMLSPYFAMYAIEPCPVIKRKHLSLLSVHQGQFASEICKLFCWIFKQTVGDFSALEYRDPSATWIFLLLPPL